MASISLSQSKKNAKIEGATIVFEDEASFRLQSTLHQTWAPRGVQPIIPTHIHRNTQKIFGAVTLHSGQFIYRHELESFNADTYKAFIEEDVLPAFYRKNHRVYYIQDNASYHKDKDLWTWLKEKQTYINVINLPPYSPELNAVERIWNYTRKNATHNKYFETKEALCDTLFGLFESIRQNPVTIKGLLAAFL